MASTKSRYDSLDAMRGLACLLVVVFHSIPYVTGWEFDTRVRTSGGSIWEWILVVCGRFWIGVPLFFTISGYCIAASADSTRNRGGGIGRYFVRRFRRIYPPLIVILAIAALVSLAFLLVPTSFRPPPSPDGGRMFVDPHSLSCWQWLGNLTLTEEWRPAIGGPPKSYLLGQVWTLCFEEQFYIVVGLLLIISRRWFFVGIWAVTALVLLNLLDLNALAGNRMGMNLNALQVHVPGLFINGLWIGFAAGVVVYYRINHAGERGVFLEFVLAGFAIIWLASEENLFDTKQSLTKYSAVSCLFALALCRLHRFDARFTRAACLAPLRFCGRMCYSLYLVHPIVTIPVAWLFYRAGLSSPAATVLVTIPVCMALSVLVSYLFFRLVERQFLNSTTSHSPVPAANA